MCVLSGLLVKPEVEIHRWLAFEAAEAGPSLASQGLPSDHHLPAHENRGSCPSKSVFIERDSTVYHFK
jgi:hypothetical protein